MNALTSSTHRNSRPKLVNPLSRKPFVEPIENFHRESVFQLRNNAADPSFKNRNPALDSSTSTNYWFRAIYIEKINWNCDDSYNFASFQSERNNRILKRIPKNPINFVEKFRIVHENEDRRQREFKPRRSRIASRINNYFVIVYTDQGFVRQN